MKSVNYFKNLYFKRRVFPPSTPLKEKIQQMEHPWRIVLNTHEWSMKKTEQLQELKLLDGSWVGHRHFLLLLFWVLGVR